MKKHVAAVTLAAAISWSSAASAAPVRITYQCNLGGQAAVLTADVEGIATGGTVPGRPGLAPIITGQNLYYAGTLVSQSARYSFRGENGFADFVDLTTNERFRVQFIAQGDYLVMIANPFGQQPARYMCQRTS